MSELQERDKEEARSTFETGERVWCRTFTNKLVRKVVVRMQMSEGPGPRWPAVRVRDEGEPVDESFNWPIEDVFHKGEEPDLPKMQKSNP